MSVIEIRQDLPRGAHFGWNWELRLSGTILRKKCRSKLEADRWRSNGLRCYRSVNKIRGSKAESTILVRSEVYQDAKDMWVVDLKVYRDTAGAVARGLDYAS